jgi:hypothetical protein
VNFLSAGSDKQKLFEEILAAQRTRLRIIARANANADHCQDLERNCLAGALPGVRRRSDRNDVENIGAWRTLQVRE